MFSLGFDSLDETPSSSTGEPPPHIKSEQSRPDDVPSPDSYLDPIPHRESEGVSSPPISLATPRDHHCAQERKRRDRVNRHFQELDALCLGVDNALMNKRRDRDAILVNAIYVIKKLKSQIANNANGSCDNATAYPYQRDSSANSVGDSGRPINLAPRLSHQGITPPPVKVSIKRASPNSGTESESISPSTNATITPLPPQAQATNGRPPPNFLTLRSPPAGLPLPISTALSTALQAGSGVPMNEVLLALRESPMFFPTPRPPSEAAAALSTPAGLQSIVNMDQSAEPTCFVSNAPPPAFGGVPLPTSPQLATRTRVSAQFSVQTGARQTLPTVQSPAPSSLLQQPPSSSTPSSSPSIPAALAALAQLPPHVIATLPPHVQAQYVQLIQEHQQQQQLQRQRQQEQQEQQLQQQQQKQQLFQQQQQLQQQQQQQQPAPTQHNLLLKQFQQQQQQNQQLQLLRQLQLQQQQQQQEQQQQQQQVQREREQQQQQAQYQQAQQLLLQQIQSRHLPRQPLGTPAVSPAPPRLPSASLSNTELLKRLEAAFALSPNIPTSSYESAGGNNEMMRSPQMNGPIPMNSTNSPLTPLIESHPNGALKRKALSAVDDVSYHLTPHGSHRCILRQLPICVVDAVGVIVGANPAALEFLFADPHTPILNDPNTATVDPSKLGSNGYEITPSVEQLPLSRCLLYFAHPDEAMRLCGILFGMIAGQRMPTYLQLRLRCSAVSAATSSPDESSHSPDGTGSAQYVSVHMILSPRKDDSERLESVDCAFVPA